MVTANADSGTTQKVVTPVVLQPSATTPTTTTPATLPTIAVPAPSQRNQPPQQTQQFPGSRPNTSSHGS